MSEQPAASSGCGQRQRQGQHPADVLLQYEAWELGYGYMGLCTLAEHACAGGCPHAQRLLMER